MKAVWPFLSKPAIEHDERFSGACGQVYLYILPLDDELLSRKFLIRIKARDFES